jgi:hypothetical protein
MATRKVGEFVFIRASDIILPNVGQFPNGGNTAETEGFAVRPFITRWVVPVDDTNSFYIGVAHLNAYNGATMDMDPEKYGVDRFPFIGQTGDRPYEERQLEPGDYDAVVSQGAIANRKAEHLGTSDRGVAQLRRALTKAITAVQDGKPVAPNKVDSRGRVRTYVHETVIRIPNGLNLDEAKALQEFGRRAAMVFVETDGLDPDERERYAEGRIRAFLQTEHAA